MRKRYYLSLIVVFIALLIVILLIKGNNLFTNIDKDNTTREDVDNNTSNYEYPLYDINRDPFESDEIFSNFRSLKGGSLKENLIYRSASPIDNLYKRASITDKLIEKDGIKYIINLSDNESEINNHITKDDFNSPYYLSLYENNKVILLDIESNYESDDYKQRVVEGLMAIVDNEGPYLIHCVEGKDRTGFVSIIIEMLCNSSYEEILDDYMITYDNYYQINKNNKTSLYEMVVNNKFNEMMYYLIGVNSIKQIENINMQKKASEYLLSGGMSQENIDELINKITIGD